eukprot:3579286-Rhodomonas_salina.1
MVLLRAYGFGTGCPCCAVPGTELGMLLPGCRDHTLLARRGAREGSGSVPPIVLRSYYAMSGTDEGHRPTRGPVLTLAMRYYQVEVYISEEFRQVLIPLRLRTCYAMSGTDLGNGALCLRWCYVMSGTDLVHGVSADALAPRCPVLT